MDIIRLDSLERYGLEIFTELTERQLATVYEPECGLFIAESEKIIRRALSAGYKPECVLCEADRDIPRCSELVSQIVTSYPECQVYAAEIGLLKQLTGYNLTGGILCAMKRRRRESAEVFLKKLEKGVKNRIVIIDNVENPTNVGAIFRSAAALGMDGILVSNDSSDPLYRRAARVSMGTVFQIPWTYLDCSSSSDRAALLHKAGYKLVSMALRNDSVKIDDEALQGEERLAIIMGNEGDGLLKETIELSDYTVMIPMYHGVDSLNVAAASAIAFYALRR